MTINNDDLAAAVEVEVEGLESGRADELIADFTVQLTRLGLSKRAIAETMLRGACLAKSRLDGSRSVEPWLNEWGERLVGSKRIAEMPPSRPS